MNIRKAFSSGQPRNVLKKIDLAYTRTRNYADLPQKLRLGILMLILRATLGKINTTISEIKPASIVRTIDSAGNRPLVVMDEIWGDYIGIESET